MYLDVVAARALGLLVCANNARLKRSVKAAVTRALAPTSRWICAVDARAAAAAHVGLAMQVAQRSAVPSIALLALRSGKTCNAITGS